MLARNFKSTADLGIPDIAFDALVKTLGILERGEVVHIRLDEGQYWSGDRPEKFTGHFNMNTWSTSEPCGSVCCIGGTAELIGGMKVGELKNIADDAIFDGVGSGLYELFYPPDSTEFAKITPAQAAAALSNYLTLGEPHWEEILKTDA